MPTAYVKNLSDDTRKSMISLLNARLADAIDLSNMVKQAHWNLKGKGFIGIHELLDGVNDRILASVDTIAERAVILGGFAEGTSQDVTERTSLEPYPGDLVDFLDHAQALMERYMAFGGEVRKAIDAAAEAGDEDTADLFTEVSRHVDKDAWFIGAHVES